MTIWFISDPHFNHENILKFTGLDGNKIRPGFDSVAQMNDCILTLHNEVVKDADHVWWHGDITMKVTDDFLKFFSKFKGRKRLIPGNHDDIIKLVGARIFEKVVIWRAWNSAGEVPFTGSHIPLEADSIKGKFNVHGHIHEKDPPSPRHINISVERTGMKPVSMEELQVEMRKRLTDAPAQR